MSFDSTQEIDVDSLLESINAAEPERAMSAPEPTENQPGAADKIPSPVQTTPQPVQEYEFDWKGQKIKAPVDKLTRWASQGYDYAQKMESFKTQQTELENKYKPYEKYKTIDEYVQKDPSWWKFVEDQWNNKLASQDPVTQRVKSMLDEELKPVREIISQQEQAQKESQIRQEDTLLANEVKSIRTKYADLDFDTPDQDGKSLEYKVLEYGAKNGFPSFKAAFLDFYHDQLEKIWESRGREAISKDTQKRQKLGLSESKPTSKKADGNFDVKGKSWNQIQDQIYAELGL